MCDTMGVIQDGMGVIQLGMGLIEHSIEREWEWYRFGVVIRYEIRVIKYKVVNNKPNNFLQYVHYVHYWLGNSFN